MVRELTPLDIRHVPEIARLVDEVTASDKPLRIVRDGEDIAVLMPSRPSSPRRRRRRITDADRQAAADTFGAWKDQVDPEVFKRERRELQVDDKPPRNL